MKNICLLGILQRSGTNYLYNLLGQHPECITHDKLPEDFLISESDWLLNYVMSLQTKWNTKWHHNSTLLIHSLSNGLMNFVGSQADKAYIVTKTPSTENIGNFFALFPDSYLIIIIRKGDDLIESGVRSFGWKYESAFYEWAMSAERILAVVGASHEPNKHINIVKYEDLCTHTESELKKIFKFCNLDADIYDFDNAQHTPVFGSSELRKQGTLHWKPIERDKAFNPTSRSHRWNWYKKARFEWICGDLANELGYESILENKGILYRLYNYFADFWYFPFKYYRSRRHILKRAYQSYIFRQKKPFHIE